MEAAGRSIETGALFSNAHTAISLHNQGNGFSFRHLTLLSKENPSCLVPPWAEAALSSILDPKQKASGRGADTHHIASLMPRCPRLVGAAVMGYSPEQHPRRYPHFPTHSQRASLGRARGMDEWGVARASVLSIHGIQVLGFNDLGQQVVAGGGGRETSMRSERSRQWAPAPARPSPAQLSPSCLLSALVPDGDHGNHDEGKDHLHVGQGAHAKGTEQQQLQDLQASEVVDLPLRHPPDVVGGWV